MGRLHRILCGRCRRWLANASGEKLYFEIKCPKCNAVTNVDLTNGILSVQTNLVKQQRPTEAIA